MKSLKNALFLSCLAWAQLAAPSALASEWPQKPIRLLIPAAPGGAADASARLLQPALAKILGQPILIDNKPGGGSVIASGEVARAEPNGYTIGFIDSSHAYNPALRSLPYDSAKDFTPIAFLWRAPIAFAVLNDSPIKSLPDLIEQAKKHPGTIGVATRGPGTGNHLAAIQLELAAGIDLNLIGYKGAGPALVDVLGGHVPVLSANVSLITDRIDAGKMRALAVTTASRSSLVPTAPTLAELGYPSFQVSEWLGIVGPAHLPREIVLKLNQAVKVSLQDPEIASKMKAYGSVSVMSPDEFSKLIASETEKSGQVIKKANIKLD